MLVEIDFSMGNNFVKSSWCDVISFEMIAGRREWSEEAVLIRREGNDWMMGFIWQGEWGKKCLATVSSCPFTYLRLPLTTKQLWTFSRVYPSLFCLLSLSAQCSSRPLANNCGWIERMTDRFQNLSVNRVPPHVTCVTWRSVFISLIPGFLICNKGRTVCLTYHLGCVQMKYRF